MRQIILSLLLILVSLPAAFANTQLERRIYYFTALSQQFRNVCFDAYGRFAEHAVFMQRGGSLKDTSMDCDATALALNEERLAIEAAINAGAEGCDLEITDASLAAFANGAVDVTEAVACPGSGGAVNCIEGVACNLTKSLVPRFATDVASFLSGRDPLSCGNDGGTDCITNFIAGAVFNVKDTGCGIASLFGYNCDSPPQNSEQVSSDALVTSTLQTNQQVATFSESPWMWMKQTASALIDQIGKSILERFGCARWSNPRLPYASTCLEPLPWSCADCSARTNMVCGVLGYIGGEVLVSFFTGAAAGVVVGAASRIALGAAEIFPEAAGLITRAGGKIVDARVAIGELAARFAGRGGASLRNAWRIIKEVPYVGVLPEVAERVAKSTTGFVRGTGRVVVSANDFARRRLFLFGAGQDLAVNSVKAFNRITQEAFAAGYRLPGQVHADTINFLLGQSAKVSDIRSGVYGINGTRITREDQYFNLTTTPAFRRDHTYYISRDGAESRIVVINKTGSESAAVGAAYDLNGASRTPAPTFRPPEVPRRPEVIVRPPEPPPVEIVVTGSGSTTRNASAIEDYPVIPASTRSQDDLARAFGGRTPYNDELATAARSEYQVPADFELEASQLHEAFKEANPQLRATRPELFVDFDQLPQAEKVRYADELARAFREGNPAALSSKGFQEFRTNLTAARTETRAAENAGIVVSDGARTEARAGSTAVRTESAAVTAASQDARVSTEARVTNEARPATTPTTTVPQRLSAFSDSASTRFREAGIDPEALIEPNQFIGDPRGPRKLNIRDPELEKAVSRFELEGRIARWEKEGTAQGIFNFLGTLRSEQDKKRILAILLNAPEGESLEVLNRLKSFEGGSAAYRESYFRTMRQRIDSIGEEITRKLPMTEANKADILRLTRKRSTLLQEVTLNELGGAVEIKSIFSSRGSNYNFAQKGKDYVPHSLDDTFSVDLRVSRDGGLNVCRGSFAGPGTSSFLVGNFTTICRSSNFQERASLSQFVAAPDDVRRVAAGDSGYNDFVRYELKQGDVISLGLNGPVEYLDAAQKGTGGVGGGVEFFAYRADVSPITPDKLAARSRIPTCGKDTCSIAYEINARVRADNLANQSNPAAYLAHERRLADTYLTSLGPRIDAFASRIPATDAEAIALLRREYGDVRAGFLTRRTVDLRDATSPLGRLAEGTLDIDSVYLRDATVEADRFGPRVTADLDGVMGINSAKERVVNLINNSDVVKRYRALSDTLHSDLERLRAGNLPEAERRALVQKVAVNSALVEDMDLPLQTLRYKASSAAGDFTGLGDSDREALKSFIKQVMTAGDGHARPPVVP